MTAIAIAIYVVVFLALFFYVGLTEEWTQGWYKNIEVTVHYKEITSYPEAGSSEALVWDFCPACFKEKVQPVLETISKPRVQEEDW